MGGNKPDPAVRARQDKVLALRLAGMNPSAIAEQEARETGNPPRTGNAINMDVTRALARRKETLESTEDATELESARMDSVLRSVQVVMQTAQSGRCTKCGRSPEPDLVLKAAGVMVRLMERRASLEDLDAKGKQKPSKGNTKMDDLRARRDAKEKRMGIRR
jgi:hypothetical protein